MVSVTLAPASHRDGALAEQRRGATDVPELHCARETILWNIQQRPAVGREMRAVSVTGRGPCRVSRSWVGTGENQSLEPDDLARAVGLDDIEAVARETGLPREQVVSDLSQHLPDFINRLTPDGRLPTDDEASRWV